MAALAVVGVQGTAQAHHGAAHRLQMVSVTCHTLLDPGDDEEPYLKLNGDRFWSHSDCAPGTRLDLSGVTRDFWADADLELMEDDFGPDDDVLYARVGPEANQGVQTRTRFVFTGVTNIPWYTMEWFVTG
ncbi:MAG TPA: hypothetical protein VFV67_01035 [Actinophytocola sp.]|nr:hypothetical protein [Actinophytocola sp.]